MNVDTVAQTARIFLKAIESLTYTCNNPQLLIELNQKLDQILSDFRHALPAEQGLVIRPLITKRVKKKEKSKVVSGEQRLLSLPLYKKRGRIRVDSKYRNRVGKRAQQLRNVRIHYVLTKFLHSEYHVCSYTYMYICSVKGRERLCSNWNTHMTICII